MGKMKEVLQNACEELYPDDFEAQDNMFQRALNGKMLDKEVEAVNKYMGKVA